MALSISALWAGVRGPVERGASCFFFPKSGKPPAALAGRMDSAKNASSVPAVERFPRFIVCGSCGRLWSAEINKQLRSKKTVSMLVAGNGGGQRKSLSGNLEGNVHNTLPVGGPAGRIGGWSKTGSLNGVDGGLPKAVAEVTGDAKHLHGAGGRDAKANRDGSLDVRCESIGGVLRARLIKHFGWLGGAGIGRAVRFMHWLRRDASQLNGRAGGAAAGVQRAIAIGHAQVHAPDGMGGIVAAIHVAAARRAGA